MVIEVLLSVGLAAPSTALPKEDRTFLDKNFKRYGSAWSGGLAAFEKRFEVQVSKTDAAFVLELKSRGFDGLAYTVTMKRADGGLSHEGPKLPGAVVTGDALTALDKALTAIGPVWFLEPSGAVSVRPLERSLRGLATPEASIEVRSTTDGWLLFAVDEPVLVVSVRQNGTLGEVKWTGLHETTGRVLSAQEVDFFDASFKKHGDFGVYGNVTAGFRALAAAPNTAMSLYDTKTGWSVTVSPRDGHGHELHFNVDRKGVISGMSAAHLVGPE